MFNAFVQFLKSLFLPLFLFMQKTRNFIVVLLKTVFPSSWAEAAVFAFFMAVYGSFASYNAIHYRIIFDNRIPWDAYFSFDNRSIVLTGGGFERHPLSNYFFDAISRMAFWFSDGKMNVNFRLFLAWCSVLTVSLALVQIFKYLRNIIRLPIWLSLLLILFTGFFSTGILLSFTPETYTYTFFLLALFNYYAALKLRREARIPGTALTVFAVAVGGLTITNIVKVYVPVFFEKNIFSTLKKLFQAAVRVLVSATVFVLLYLNRLDFDISRIFSKTTEQYEKFSQPKVIPVWDMVISWFFGGNVLFSGFVTRDYHSKTGFQYKALFMDVYTEFWQYLFVFVLLALVFWSWVKNFRNRLANVLMVSFMVDIVIHCILKFGLHTSYIYGGHFVFVYPLMLGWLFYSFRNRPNTFSILMILMSLMMVYLGFNNFYRMQDFCRFLELYYR